MKLVLQGRKVVTGMTSGLKWALQSASYSLASLVHPSIRPNALYELSVNRQSCTALR